MRNVTIQSMTTTQTSDIRATVAQINRLTGLGCDIIRIAVPDKPSADAIAKIKENITIPLVADIHFDHKLALRAVEAGADKIRINPGNIDNNITDKGSDKIKAIAEICKRKDIPVRIGVNSGSLEKDILDKHGGVTPEAMFESALRHVKLFNKYDFNNIWLSAKTSNVLLTVNTYRLLHEQLEYPLHIGITEAGTEYSGIIKSSIGIGALLLNGIGNTIRVSLTAQPDKEIEAAKAILKALHLRPGYDIISCPTCGRCKIDLIPIAQEVEKRLSKLEHEANKTINHSPSDFRTPNSEPVTVAVMGCSVNGPGEASQADYGIAGGDMDGLIFAKGKIIKKAPMHTLVDELFNVIDSKR